MNDGLIDDRPRVVVVGAGIVGAFAAYFLAHRGVRVDIIERDPVGTNASGRNAGGLNPLHGPGIPGPLLELALASFDLHQRCWDEIETGVDRPVAGQRIQRLHVCMSDVERPGLARLATLHDTTPGFSAEWLTADEIRRVIPGLSEEVKGGLMTAGSVRVDPGPYVRGVLDAALRHGATLHRTDVVGLSRTRSRVDGVESAIGILPCDAVVIAPGPWCGRPGAWLRVDFPVSPLKGELLEVEMADACPEADVTWGDVGVYPTAGRRAWVGGTESASGFDRRPTEAGRRQILEGLAQLAPGYQPLRVIQHVAALRPVTPDGLPLIGLFDDPQNICVVSGGGRKGMLLGAALGHAAADLVTTGASDLPIECCHPDRSALVP